MLHSKQPRLLPEVKFLNRLRAVPNDMPVLPFLQSLLVVLICLTALFSSLR
jgi:hypothetical protein